MLAEPRTTGVAARIRRRGAGRAAPTAFGPEIWLVIALTAVAALLRFATITSQSFWVDEATTVHEVGLSFGQMLHELRLNETTPPLYFALAWVWTRVFGAGELGIRSLSAVAGTLLIPVVFLCGRELVSRATGVVAAAFATLSPFMIWYSQEARAYMLLALLCALSFLFAARAARTGERRDLVAWSATSLLAVLTHFFAGFLVAPEALWLLWRVRRRDTVVACAAVGIAQIAVLPLAIGDTTHPLNWLTQFHLSSRVNATPVDFAVSALYDTANRLAGYGLLGSAALGVVVALLLWRGGGVRERRGAVVAIGLALCVVMIPIVLAWLGRDYVYNRNFMPAWVPLAVGLAAACTAPRARIAGGAVALLVIAAFLWAGLKINSDPYVQRPNWRAAAAALGPSHGVRAIVAEDGNDAEQPLAVYLPRTRFSYLGFPTSTIVSVDEVDVVGDQYTGLRPAAELPPDVHLISATVVSVDIEVWRFAVDPAWDLSTDAIVARAQQLFTDPNANPSVLIQR